MLELPPALLILDLDETLIHSTEHQLERQADFKVGSYFTYKRPHLERFLEVCFEHFEVAVWTASSEDYASKIVTEVFGTRALKFFWSRERCTLRYFEDTGERIYTKPLAKVRKLGLKLERGRTLYLWGNPGNAKTHLACAIGFQALERESVVFWNVAALYAALRESVANDTPRPNLLTPGVLILDDLGKVKTSEFVYETLYACLESRWSNAKTTILTANHKPGIVADRLTPSSLDREASDAILSRLVAGRVIEIQGEDRREGQT